MLIDLLTSTNYIMVNMDAIRVLGLQGAVYTAELLALYKKAKMKEKLVEDKYFKIDRKFISKRTSLTLEEQAVCDAKLEQVGIVRKYNNEVDTIFFDVELYASLLSSEDIAIREKAQEVLKVESKASQKEKKANALVTNLKRVITTNNVELLTAYRDWIDTIVAVRGGMSAKQVELFQSKVNAYTQGDLDKALAVINKAIEHSCIDADYAISMTENVESGGSPYYTKRQPTRATAQRYATAETVNTKKLF